MSALDRGKEAVAAFMAGSLSGGETVFFGAGSTVELLVRKIGEREAKRELEADSITAVAAAPEVEEIAREAGLRLLPFRDYRTVETVDVAVDGADQFDREGRLLKGGGGQFLRERQLIDHARTFGVRWHILVQPAKEVERLGTNFPVPLEVPIGQEEDVAAKAASYGEPVLRRGGDGEPYKTPEGNHILDLNLTADMDASELAQRLEQMEGVLSHGIFLGYDPVVLVGHPDGSVERRDFIR